MTKNKKCNIVIPSTKLLNIKGDNSKIMYLLTRILMIIKPK